MSMFNKIYNAVATVRDSLKIGWSMPPKRTSESWADMYHKSPMLDPVHMIATDVAGVPYKLHDRAKYRIDPQNSEAIGDHAIYDLLDHPMPDHPEIDYFTLMYLTDAYFELIGEVFWLIDKDSRGFPIGIYIIPPSWMLLTPTANVPLFRIQPMGNTSHKYFNASISDVVWFKAPDVLNPYGRGRARAEAIGDEVETHEFASKYSKNFFYNDAVPPIILEMPGISKEQAEVFKENWVQKLGGYLNARKPAVVGQKDFKVHTVGISQKEMDYTESRKYLIQMANEHFCVPPEMRGNLQGSNRATIDSAFYLWTKNVVTKRLRSIESVLNNQFVVMFDKTITWKFENVVPDDEIFRLEVLSRGLAAGTVTRNEWRLGMKLSKDNSNGDVYLMGFNVMEIPAFKMRTVSDETDEAPAELPEPEKMIDLDAVIKEIDEKSGMISSRLHNAATNRQKLFAEKTKITSEQKTVVLKMFDAKALAGEDGFKKAVQKFAGIQKSKVVSAIESVKDEKDFKKAIDNEFNKESNIALKRALAPCWLLSLKEGESLATEVIGKHKDIGTEATNAWFNKWIEKGGLLKAGEINDTTHKALLAKLQSVLSEDLKEGLGLRKITASLLDATDGVYDNMNLARAELIARTETCSSVNYGQYATYKEYGVEKKEWISSPDKDRTRPDHLEANGKIVGMDKDFIVGGEPMNFPGDPDASAEQVCNCRCTFVAVFED